MFTEPLRRWGSQNYAIAFDEPFFFGNVFKYAYSMFVFSVLLNLLAVLRTLKARSSLCQRRLNIHHIQCSFQGDSASYLEALSRAIFAELCALSPSSWKPFLPVFKYPACLNAFVGSPPFPFILSTLFHILWVQNNPGTKSFTSYCFLKPVLSKLCTYMCASFGGTLGRLSAGLGS